MLKEAVDIRFDCAVCPTLQEGQIAFEKNKYDIILLDLSLPDSHGLGTFEKVLSFSKNTPVIVLTGMGDTDMALDAVKYGAQDYLQKNGLFSELLVKSILFSIERKNVQHELQQLNNELEAKVLERTEELAYALDKEVQMGEMKSSFVTMASHEFRTPLAGIMSSVNLIESYAKKGISDKQLKHADHIKKSVNNLVSILDDFLSIEQFDQGKVRTQVVEFNLEEFINEIVTNLEPLTSENQDIIVECTSNRTITTDKNILRNIIVNLISNAMKYSEDNVYLSAIYLDSQNLEVKVVDRGIGIPVEDQKDLFGKFFRARNAANFQGTGLGLHIVKRYVELLKGDISFESLPSHETTFTVNIPVNI